IALHGRVDKLVDPGEIDDLVELLANFGTAHSEDRAVEEDVLAAGELGVETGADFQEAGDAAVDFDAASRRLGDLRENFEECAFSCPARTDDADTLSGLHVDRDVPQGPE